MHWALVFVFAAFAAVVRGQDSPVFRTDVFQVHVDAEVLGSDARIISGLSANDFRVFDEGREQKLVGFVAEQEELDIILLFDTSSSMRSKVSRIASAAQEALHELKHGDRVSVMAFNNQVHVISSFTTDLDAAANDIHDIVNARFGGLTYMQQALNDGARCFLKDSRTRRRRAILIITDNLGIRTRNEMSVIHNLWEADAVLCGLTIRDPGYPVRRAIVAVFAPYVLTKVGGMDRIAEKTGGDVIHLEDPSRGFPEMMHRIRSRYSIYYPMPEGEPGSYRSIRVQLSDEAQKRFPEARVYARRGYRLNKSQ